MYEMDKHREEQNGFSEILYSSQKESLSPVTRIQIGENVKIKAIDNETRKQMDAEDYFYLKSFENKIGIVCEEQESRSGRYSYRVEFNDNRFGYFYSKDLILIPEK